MNKDNNLTKDENSVNFYICFLAISSIINKVLSYYLLLCSFTQRNFMCLTILIALFAWSCLIRNVKCTVTH